MLGYHYRNSWGVNMQLCGRQDTNGWDLGMQTVGVLGYYLLGCWDMKTRTVGIQTVGISGYILLECQDTMCWVLGYKVLGVWIQQGGFVWIHILRVS